MADHDSIRRFIRAAIVVDEARRMDEYWTEVRANTPANYYWPGASRLFASELARLVPREFGTLEEIEAIALELTVGSDGATKLAAIETIAREVIEGRKRPRVERVEPDEEPQEQPPEPPADWMPGEQGGKPIEIKSAAAVPEAVKRAQARRAAGK